MTTRKPHRDIYTGDLFTLPVPAATGPGSLNIDPEVRALMSAMLKRSPDTRNVVAGKMADLLGDDITVHQLNAWTAESREGHRFPVAYLPAFEAAVASFDLSELLAVKRGGKFLVGEEALEAELGRLDSAEQQIKARKAELRQRLGRGRR